MGVLFANCQVNHPTQKYSTRDNHGTGKIKGTNQGLQIPKCNIISTPSLLNTFYAFVYLFLRQSNSMPANVSTEEGPCVFSGAVGTPMSSQNSKNL